MHLGYDVAMHHPGVRRSTELDLDTAGTLRALTDPVLLSHWLGRWEHEADEGGAVVTTDDGVRRCVEQLQVRPDGVRWRWAPVDRPEEQSEVTLLLEAIDTDRTRLTVVEMPADGAPQASAAAQPPVALDAIKWSICLLMLELAATQSTAAAAV